MRELGPAGSGFRHGWNPLRWLMTLKCGYAMVMEIRWRRNAKAAPDAWPGLAVATDRGPGRTVFCFPELENS